MSLAPSKSISRVKEGKIFGWSGSYGLTSSAVTLLNYTNPPFFYLTRITLGIDWSGISDGEVLSFTVNVDGQNLYTEKLVVTASYNGFQPKMLEFIIPPNSTVKIQAVESANNGAMTCVLTGYRV